MPQRPGIFASAICATTLSVLLLTSCAKIAVDKKGSTTTTTTTATSPGANTPVEDPTTLQVGQIPKSVAGDWAVSFQYGNKTLVSSITLQQTGTQFTGSGSDVDGGLTFTIDGGHVENGAVRFYKKYKDSTPIEYTGKLEVVQEADYKGPFMSGDYTTASKGKIITNLWQAQMKLHPQVAEQPAQNAAPSQQQGGPDQGQPGQQQGGASQGQLGGDQGQQQGGPDQGQQPGGDQGQQQGGPDQGQQQGGDQPAAAPMDHPPDISGKWNVGYVFNFKTMHSTMFIEQEGDRVTGHGSDENTREKFVIEKGWYHYPKLTIIRKYVKGKGASRSYTMAFKATVQNVNDADYSGPYLKGETQGGGPWEAQLVN